MRRAYLLLAIAAACGPRTEIVIGFATDYKAPVPLDEIKLEVVRQDGFPEGGDGLTWEISGALDQPYNLPASYGIYSDGTDVQLDVTLEGLSGGSAILSQTVTLSLVSDETLFYRMGLTGDCASMQCGALTCIEGACVDPVVKVHQLPTYSPDLVTELTCVPPVVQYEQTQDGSPMPLSANAASCPPELCVQGLCLNPPSGGGSGGSGGSGADTYLKPGYVSPNAFYGEFNELAMSADGNTIVLGGGQDSFTGVGVNPDESAPMSAFEVGGVYVFERSGGTWAQSAYLKSSNDEMGDLFGGSVAISGDGSTIAVGAGGEASGNPADQSDNSVGQSGAVYIFSRAGASWMQTAYLKAQYIAKYNAFGEDVALSNDGTTLAVGEPLDASSATGIDSTPDTSEANSGSVYVFTFGGGTWTQQAYIKPAVVQASVFGDSLALSSDGNTLAVGAHLDSSSATGIDGDASNTSASNSGAAYIFTRTGATWSQDAYIKPATTQVEALFGTSISLSGSGNQLAVGANWESSDATGIDGNASDMSATKAGAAYLFTRSGGTWSQQHYLKASNTTAGADFGTAVKLSADGNTLLVGAINDASGATGIDGNQADTSTMSAGAAYLFTQSGGTWTQAHYVKASNTRAAAYFGYGFGLSTDASSYVISAPGDSSGATGVDGNQSDTSGMDSGAAYVFSQ